MVAGYLATPAVSKQSLPVFEKPMIYYPLGVLMLAGIAEVLIGSAPIDLPRFRELLGTGSAYGLCVSYAESSEPNGLSAVLTIGRAFVGDSRAALILRNSIFCGGTLVEMRPQAAAQLGWRSQGRCLGQERR